MEKILPIDTPAPYYSTLDPSFFQFHYSIHDTMYYTYVLQSKLNGRYYIGSTVDLINRLREHNGGKNISIKNGIPWVIVYSEVFTSLREARRRERQIKSWKNPEYMARKLSLNNLSGERPD